MDAVKQARLNRRLLNAAEDGGLARVKRAVAAGADPRCGGDDPIGARTWANDRVTLHPLDHPLYLAAVRDHLPVVRYLIEECGADPHMLEDECACWAAKSGCLAVLRYFLEEHHVDPGVRENWLLREGANTGGLAIVRYLVEERGVDPRARDDEAMIWAAAEGGDQTVIDYLAKRIFAPDLWRGQDRAVIEAEAGALIKRVETALQAPPDWAKTALEPIWRRALETIANLRAEAERANPLKLDPKAQPVITPL